ncbi:MAG: HAD family hydrolase [Pyrinomonadaceae bacterium]
MIKAIFFDFNGVIIDDEPLQMAAYQQVLRDQSIELTETDYYSALGMDDKHFVWATYERANMQLTDEVLRLILEKKAVHHRKLIENELPLFPGVLTFLKATSRHYSLGLVSMATREEIEYTLNRARLRSHFSVIVSAENVNVCKPAPDCYRIALEQLNTKLGEARLLPLLPRECLVIEDSPPGIASGRQAGMRTLGITNTVSAGALREASAEIVTTSLADWTVDAVHHVFSGG